jgi:hypothetical protein
MKNASRYVRPLLHRSNTNCMNVQSLAQLGKGTSLRPRFTSCLCELLQWIVSHSAGAAMRKRYDSCCCCFGHLAAALYLSVFDVLRLLGLLLGFESRSWSTAVLLQYHWNKGQPVSWHPSMLCIRHGPWHSWAAFLPFSPTVLLEPASVSTTTRPPEPPPRTARTSNPPLSNCHTMCVKHFGSYCIYRTQPLCGKRAPSGSGHWAEGEAGV